MAKVSYRECYFIKVKSPNIDYLIDEVKLAIEELGVPPEYDIQIYKNVYACCGVSGIGLIIEVAGPEEKEIKTIDLKVVSKILEICEKEGFEYHTFEPFAVM